MFRARFSGAVNGSSAACAQFRVGISRVEGGPNAFSVTWGRALSSSAVAGEGRTANVRCASPLPIQVDA